MSSKAERKFLDAVDELMDEIIDSIFADSQQNLVKDGKIDTANLLKSGNVNRGYLKKEIVYTAPYAEAVEFGRSPGMMPPSDALEKWVIRKLGVDPKRAKSVAYAIALNIKERGIMPSPFIRPAFEKAEKDFKLVKLWKK